MIRPLRHATLTTAMLLAAHAALAERADRQQPVNIEANKVVVDDRNQVHTFEGEVLLSQGTLSIKGERLVVTQGADGFQNGVATASQGGLASFRQRREGRSDYVEGRGERIEYDSRSERVRLIGQAWVNSGGDEVRGQVIEYDGLTDNYTVNGGGGSRGEGGRVRAVIQPKNPPGGEDPAKTN